jgi:LCP family protein required for cell wall assembly
MDKVICASCKTRFGTDDRFCPKCGEVMTARADDDRASTARNSSLLWLDAALRRQAQPRLRLSTFAGGADITAAAPTPIISAPPVAPAASPAPVAQAVEPRLRWHRRPWYRRPRFVIPLLVLFMGGIAIGAVAFTIHRTFTALHHVSTPASSVSGSALGGDESVVIDTGPARTALAAAVARTPTTTATPTTFPTATATDTGTTSASTVATSVPSDATTPASATESVATGHLPPPPASTVSPTAETTDDIQDTPPSPTPEPSKTSEPTLTETASSPNSTPTVAISQIERIENGGFEHGNADWWIEGGAGSVETVSVSGTHALVIPAQGAWVDQRIFFLGGTTYRLSGWGKVGAAGDTGQIGVAYRNNDGERLHDLEPAPIKFASTEYTQQQLTFTVPDGVAEVKIYVWKPSGTGDFSVDDLSFRSEVPPTDLKAAATARDNDAIILLMMGVDARPGEAIDVGVRPDSLMVLRLDPDTGSCRTLAIPRDTRTELPGYGQSKVNHALAVGGIPYQMQVVEGLLGVTIDHYVLIDFAGFQDMVDAVGGITIEVSEPFVIDEYIRFDMGTQTLDGKHALAYARFRGGSDGDFGRIARQQQVLRGLLRKAAKLNVVRSLNELLPAVEQHLRTDLDPSEMARIGLDYRETCTEESVQMLRLEGYVEWFDDPLLQLQLQYLVVDEAEIETKMSMFEER